MPLSQPSRNYVQSEEIASRTLNVGDAFQMLYSNNGALVFTVPPDVFGDGVQISLCDWDAGVPLFAAGVGVTLNTSGGLGPLNQFQVTTIIRVPPGLVAGDENTWFVMGSV
jgi:hypothetical protein